MPEFAEDLGKNEVEKEQDEEIERPGIFSKISAQTIKQIMELLCDESVSLKTGHGCMPCLPADRRQKGRHAYSLFFFYIRRGQLNYLSLQCQTGRLPVACMLASSSTCFMSRPSRRFFTFTDLSLMSPGRYQTIAGKRRTRRRFT